MPRKTALEVLLRVDRDGAYSHIALSAALDEAKLSDADRGLATELVYGTLTWRRALDALIDQHARRGTHGLELELLEALRLGAYQLVFLDRIPAHAATNETVELARKLVNNSATKLANAVMRRIAEKPDAPWWNEADRGRKPARYLGARWSLPNWLANRLIQQFGFERAESLAEAFTRRPPLWVRRVGRPGDASEKLEGMDATAREGLASGEFVVQDLGSQVIVRLCQIQPGERVLDGCAGLGGKTTYLAETAAEVVAVDPVATKLEMLREAAERVGVASRVKVVESELQSAALEGEFDVVLVDAPCTGLGIIRRHPETRWTRNEPDIQTLAMVQAELLAAAAAHVRPGGRLVYSVCTWTREETSRQVERFLESHPDFAPGSVPEELARYRDEAHSIRTFPDLHDADSFYAATLIRRQ